MIFSFMPKKHTLENFIEESVGIHGNRYDYSKVDYLNARTKVCIVCPIHGVFWKIPDKHINLKQGCPKCSGKKRPSTEEYITKVNEVHNCKYDYSETVYQNKNTKICIICHQRDENGIEHGKFYQIAHNHLNGNGCPHCKESLFEKRVVQFLRKMEYNIWNMQIAFYSLGYTNNIWISIYQNTIWRLNVKENNIIFLLILPEKEKNGQKKNSLKFKN